ncbi:hypothetical protein VOLCADRAFT_92500 [Volvox carteri f. nagariensis]|uniref:Uncharacterized protein n=1 Tax=Volvox carteri f. nagariensis TaxID=3068 RepID=D8TZT8_VOLCA|nr:uncharacterized protein VOLCADRAFT_92500 [Volvox carteri f. nagariensis]EFJ46982.1 hypothetical protein VOLCADRAFT_92500 [Volvox carteri f. nagariensis]|eukprot:XP_002951877.1 hypothetical protein VOLCADRAFT_92500 [Volvox carteri f. nagariensis]
MTLISPSSIMKIPSSERKIHTATRTWPMRCACACAPQSSFRSDLHNGARALQRWMLEVGCIRVWFVKQLTSGYSGWYLSDSSRNFPLGKVPTYSPSKCPR